MKISPVAVWRYNKKRRRLLGKVGKLEHYSIVRVGPIGMEKRVPYIIGLVNLGKEKVIVQIIDVNEEKLKPGIQVVGRLRRLFDVDDDAVIVYGIKFVPVLP